MLLTLDRGNTTLDAMLHSAAPRRERRAPDAALASFLGADRPRRCVGVSVVPGGPGSLTGVAFAPEGT